MLVGNVEIDDQLVQHLVPGAQVRLYRGPGAHDNELRHIREIVDINNVVYRVWWKHHRRWEYKVVWMYVFQLEWKQGWLILCKERDDI